MDRRNSPRRKMSPERRTSKSRVIYSSRKRSHQKAGNGNQQFGCDYNEKTGYCSTTKNANIMHDYCEYHSDKNRKCSKKKGAPVKKRGSRVAKAVKQPTIPSIEPLNSSSNEEEPLLLPPSPQKQLSPKKQSSPVKVASPLKKQSSPVKILKENEEIEDDVDEESDDDDSDEESDDDSEEDLDDFIVEDLDEGTKYKSILGEEAYEKVDLEAAKKGNIGENIEKSRTKAVKRWNQLLGVWEEAAKEQYDPAVHKEDIGTIFEKGWKKDEPPQKTPNPIRIGTDSPKEKYENVGPRVIEGPETVIIYNPKKVIICDGECKHGEGRVIYEKADKVEVVQQPQSNVQVVVQKKIEPTLISSSPVQAPTSGLVKKRIAPIMISTQVPVVPEFESDRGDEIETEGETSLFFKSKSIPNAVYKVYDLPNKFYNSEVDFYKKLNNGFKEIMPRFYGAGISKDGNEGWMLIEWLDGYKSIYGLVNDKTVDEQGVKLLEEDVIAARKKFPDNIFLQDTNVKNIMTRKRLDGHYDIKFVDFSHAKTNDTNGLSKDIHSFFRINAANEEAKENLKQTGGYPKEFENLFKRQTTDKGYNKGLNRQQYNKFYKKRT